MQETPKQLTPLDKLKRDLQWKFDHWKFKPRTESENQIIWNEIYQIRLRMLKLQKNMWDQKAQEELAILSEFNTKFTALYSYDEKPTTTRT